MSNKADARIVIDRLLRDADWDIEHKAQVSTKAALSRVCVAAGRLTVRRVVGMKSYPSPPIFRAMADRSPAVGMTNKQCPLLRDSQTAPTARFSSASMPS